MAPDTNGYRMRIPDKTPYTLLRKNPFHPGQRSSLPFGSSEKVDFQKRVQRSKLILYALKSMLTINM